MAGGVIFNYANWVLRYPEFALVSAPLAQLYFNEATSYCDNSPTTLVTDTTQLTTFLNMLTAHIAKLNAVKNGQPVNPMVGRISNASEGSVSVATENQYPPGTVQWYQQTQYGAAFWAASAGFRTMRYVSGKHGSINPFQPNRFIRH